MHHLNALQPLIAITMGELIILWIGLLAGKDNR